MTEIDFSFLRPLLDEEESFALSIKDDDPRIEIARQILAIVADARARLTPSKDSTMNYVPHKQIIEELARLREQAER
jgi:hypothetical protein